MKIQTLYIKKPLPGVEWTRVNPTSDGNYDYAIEAKEINVGDDTITTTIARLDDGTAYAVTREVKNTNLRTHTATTTMIESHSVLSARSPVTRY